MRFIARCFFMRDLIEIEVRADESGEPIHRFTPGKFVRQRFSIDQSEDIIDRFGFKKID